MSENDEPMVPVSELRPIIEDFREDQAQCDLPRSGLTNEGVIFKECADKVEELVEKYE
jgi:hypothetical protein